MRQRPSFRATAWESLEDRQLLSTVPLEPLVNALPPGIIPNLGDYLLQFDQRFGAHPTPGATATGGTGGTGAAGAAPQQPQVLVKPPVVVPTAPSDAPVTLSRLDVAKLNAVVNIFAASDTGGRNPNRDAAAIATFKSSLANLDAFLRGEHHLAGGTPNVLTPLLTGSTPTSRTDVNTLQSVVSTFSTTDTYGLDPSRDAAALNSLESSLNLLETPAHE